MNTQHFILNQIERFNVVLEPFTSDASKPWRPTLNRLVRSQRLSRWKHRSGLRYWTTFSRNPMSDASLVRAVAVLLYCQQSECDVLIKQEFEEYFPMLFRHGLPRSHYVRRTSDGLLLGHVRVDSTVARVGRIATQNQRMITKYRMSAGFAELIESGRFELTWIVPTTSKQRRLIEAFQCHQHCGAHLHVVAMPELLNLLNPIPTT